VLYIPQFKDLTYVVQFAEMSSSDHYVNYHKDSNDVAPQYHITCGSYRGAYLQCFDPKKKSSTILSNPYVMTKMDGRLGHKVLKTHFTGVRYTIVYYLMDDVSIRQALPLFYPPKVVY